MTDEVIDNLVKKGIMIVDKKKEAAVFTPEYSELFVSCIRRAYDDKEKLKVNSFDDLLDKSMYGAILIWNKKRRLELQDAEILEESITCIGLMKVLKLEEALKAAIMQDKELYAHMKEENLI